MPLKQQDILIMKACQHPTPRKSPEIAMYNLCQWVGHSSAKSSAIGVVSCEQRENSLIPTLRSENLANVSTECFSLHLSPWWKCQQGFPISKLVSKNSLFCSCRNELRSNHFEFISCGWLSYLGCSASSTVISQQWKPVNKDGRSNPSCLGGLRIERTYLHRTSFMAS